MVLCHILQDSCFSFKVKIIIIFLYRYRRTYDSEFTAPLVFYHVWPTLMENDAPIVKGEAVTKRGALVRKL